MAFLTWLGVAKELWDILQSLIKSAEVEGANGETKHRAVLDALRQIYDIVGGIPGVKGTPAWGVVSIIATRLIPTIVALFNAVGLFKNKVVAGLVLGVVLSGGVLGAVGQEFVQVCGKSENGFPQCRYVEFKQSREVEVKRVVYTEGLLREGEWSTKLLAGMKEENMVYVSRGSFLLYKVGRQQLELCGSGNCYAVEDGRLFITPVRDAELGLAVKVVWLE